MRSLFPLGKAVFVHGSPGDATMWQPFLAQASHAIEAHAAEVICIELLDHGSRTDPDATLDTTVLDLIERVRSMDGPVTLVGHSFGAWVAARAISKLSKVSRFVAISGFPGFSEAHAGQQEDFAVALESGALSLAEAARIAASLWLPSDAEANLVARIHTLLEGDTGARLGRQLRRQAGLASREQWVELVGVPTLHLHAVHDRAVPLAMGQALMQKCASPAWVELAGDSHFPHWTSPAPLTELIFEQP